MAHVAIKLCRVHEEDRAVIGELLDEYLPELARHRERSTGAIDAASYKYLPLYWTDSGRHAFTIVVEGQLAGFLLVRQVGEGAAPVSQVSEFYVRPSFRRRGVGRAAARAIWERFPGAWELQVHGRNAGAAAFWRTCIEEIADGSVEVREVVEEDGRRVQYNFSGRRPTGRCT